jgi:endonuclease/exonuclease/phosphatase family metal-dependent hydrolase
VAGDFNTDPGQRQFEGERTLKMFEKAGFTSALASLPRAETITWPAADGFPDATFDHVLVKGIQVKSVLVLGRSTTAATTGRWSWTWRIDPFEPGVSPSNPARGGGL